MSGLAHTMSYDLPGPDCPWEAPVTTTPTHLPAPSVTEMNPAEWKEAMQRALDRLHLTYQQLADMARQRDFTSLEARKLWVAIGDQES